MPGISRGKQFMIDRSSHVYADMKLICGAEQNLLIKVLTSLPRLLPLW